MLEGKLYYGWPRWLLRKVVVAAKECEADYIDLIHDGENKGQRRDCGESQWWDGQC